MHLKTSIRPFLLSLGVGPLAAGCAPGSPAPPRAPILGFGHHAVSSVRYQVTDATHMSVVTPTGDITTRAEGHLTLDVDFAEHADGTLVTATVAEYESKTENDMAGTTTADTDDIEGPLVFVIDDRGAVDVQSLPETPGEPGGQARFASIARSLFPRLPGGQARFASIARSLFPRLPSQAAEPGFSWTDTVTWSFDDEQSVTTTAVYRYSLAGDTVVDGRQMARIEVAGDGETVIEVDQSGMQVTSHWNCPTCPWLTSHWNCPTCPRLPFEVFQSGRQVTMTLSGAFTGVALWDWQQGILHSMNLEQEADGTGEMGMPGMPPLNLEGSERFSVQRVPSAGGSP